MSSARRSKILTMPQTSLALALVAVFLLSASVLAENADTKVGIKFEAGPNPIGIFFVGNQTKAFKGHTVCADPGLRCDMSAQSTQWLISTA